MIGKGISTLRSALSTAKKHFENERYQQASDIYLDCLSKLESQTENYKSISQTLAKCYLHLGKADKALEFCPIDPSAKNQPAIRYIRAKAYVLLSDQVRAIDELLSITLDKSKFDVTCFEAHMLLATLYIPDNLAAAFNTLSSNMSYLKAQFSKQAICKENYTQYSLEIIHHLSQIQRILKSDVAEFGNLLLDLIRTHYAKGTNAEQKFKRLKEYYATLVGDKLKQCVHMLKLFLPFFPENLANDVMSRQIQVLKLELAKFELAATSQSLLEYLAQDDGDVSKILVDGLQNLTVSSPKTKQKNVAIEPASSTSAYSYKITKV